VSGWPGSQQSGVTADTVLTATVGAGRRRRNQFPQHVDPDTVTVDGHSDHLKLGGSRRREGVVSGRGVL
jgi:hypothetical protein